MTVDRHSERVSAAFDAAQSDTARLVYVRCGEELRHVSTFRHRSVNERRSAVCPSCGAPVTIRLGDRRAWHAAHRPGTGVHCSVTVGESALHLNTKIALCETLLALARDPARRAADGGLLPLELALACVGSGDCRVPAWREWPIQWDDVQVECRVGVHTPDLVLFRCGQAIAAIEILVSHAVAPEKAAALRGRGVPWIEVSAADLDMAGPRAWTPDRPLPVFRASRGIATWRCPLHEAERLLADAREAYRARKAANGIEATELDAWERTLQQMEAETARLVHEVMEVRARAAAEDAELRRQREMLPLRLAEAEYRRDVARHDYEAVVRASEQHRERIAADREWVTARERELRGLDDELVRFDGLRRALSGLRPLDVPPYPHPLPPGRRTLFWCPVDVYRTKGYMGNPSMTRGVFRVDRVIIEGKVPELWLVEDRDRCLHRADASDGAESILFAVFERRIEEWRDGGRRHGIIVDRPSEWIRVAPGESVPEAAWDGVRGPVRSAYEWDAAARRWVLPSRPSEGDM